MAEHVAVPPGTIPPMPGAPANVPGAPAPGVPPAGAPPYLPAQHPQFQQFIASQTPAAPQVPPTNTPPQPANEPQANGDLAAAIAALTAALGKPAAPAEPTGAQVSPDAPNVAPAGDLNEVDVDGITDPVIRSMALALGTGAEGLDFNRVLGNAIQRGDPALIDRAYLIEKFGQAAASRITLAEGIVRAVNEHSERAAQSVYSAAGGKEQWAASAAAFNKSAPQELRAIVKNMLDSGNPEYVQAAAKLVVESAKSSGLVPVQNPAVTAGAGLAGAQALSKDEFQAELRKLDPAARDFQAKRGELFARRQLGKQLNK